MAFNLDGHKDSVSEDRDDFFYPDRERTWLDAFVSWGGGVIIGGGLIFLLAEIAGFS
jgi:hypothetical protein